MAHYNRQILVPYLQDIYSVELLCEKLSRQFDVDEYRICQAELILNTKVSEPVPPYREKETSLSIIGVFFWVMAVLCVVSLLSLFLGLSNPKGGKGFIVFMMVLGFVMFAFLGWVFNGAKEGEQQQAYERENNRYLRERDNFDKYKKERAEALTIVSDCSAEQKFLKEKYSKAKELREKLYSANIIPSQYRNVYAAYYIYDYFSTSKETDLDKIIQTMLLEEIKQRLDRVIETQEEIILNQRRELALQQQNNKALAKQHLEAMNAIARLESNQELQLDYQQMIEGNTAATAFFAAANYIENI